MEEETNIANNTILEALSLNNPTPVTEPKNVLLCIFCDHSEARDLLNENKAILQHMYMEHRLVIADVNEVQDLGEYLQFWKHEFEGKIF